MSVHLSSFPQAAESSGRENPLLSTRRGEIQAFTLTMLNDAIAGWATEDTRRQAAVSLYQEIPEILDQGKVKAREILDQKYALLTEADMAIFEHARLVRSMLVVLSAIIADRNRPDDAAHNPYHFESTVRLAAQAGLTDRDLMVFLSDIDVRNSITGHPNEHLNQTGKRLFNRAVSIADLPPEHRQPAFVAVVNEMLRTPLTPTRKKTGFEETDNAIEQALIYRNGQRIAFYKANEAIRNVYGHHVTPPDLKNAKVRPNIVLQTWQAGGDADGRFNADRWALLHGMLSLTRAAAEDHLNDIVMAEKAIAEAQPQSLTDRFEKTGRAELCYVSKALSELRTRLDHIEQRFIDIDAEGQKTLKPGVDYEVIKEEFANVYKSLSIGNVKIRNREGFTRELEANLNYLAASLKNEQARGIIAASGWLFAQYKLTVAQIETRHTGTVLAKMMDNLFVHQTFPAKANINPDALQGGKFTALTPASQRILLKQLGKNLSPQERLKAIYVANPESRDSNGYFVQTHEFQKRLELIGLNPDQFGMAIIAESNPMSADYQQFLAEAANVNTLLHTMLPEEYDTLKDLDGSMDAYQSSGGDSNIRERMLANEDGWSGGQLRVAGMIPCSDSTKILGRLVTWMQVEAVRKNFVGAVKSGIGRLLKWGNGAAIERTGGDIFAYTRYGAQMLQQHVRERGYPLDPDNSSDHVLLRMGCFYSHTEQGRAQRIDSPTPGKVASTMMDIVAEMLGRRLELMGLVKEGTYIPQMSRLSERMHKHLNSTAFACMLEYQAFREAVPVGSSIPVTNSWAEKVGALRMTGRANQSPRAASKSGDIQATKVRAIQMNDILRTAQTKHDGWFICGEAMKITHAAYNAGQLSISDINDFMQEEWWRRSFFSRALTAAVPSDLSKGFRELGTLDRWNFDRAVKIGASVKVTEENTAKEKVPRFTYDSSDSATPEEAYQAKLFYDQVLFASVTEAALASKTTGLNGKIAFDRPLQDLIGTVRPADNSLNILFGEKTMRRWKHVKEITEQERQALPEQVLVDRLEKNPASESTERLVIAGYREALFPDIRRLLGRTGYGRRQEPAWKNILTVEPSSEYHMTGEPGPVNQV